MRFTAKTALSVFVALALLAIGSFYAMQHDWSHGPQDWASNKVSTAPENIGQILSEHAHVSAPCVNTTCTIVGRRSQGYFALFHDVERLEYVLVIDSETLNAAVPAPDSATLHMKRSDGVEASYKLLNVGNLGPIRVAAGETNRNYGSNVLSEEIHLTFPVKLENGTYDSELSVTYGGASYVVRHATEVLNQHDRWISYVDVGFAAVGIGFLAFSFIMIIRGRVLARKQELKRWNDVQNL